MTQRKPIDIVTDAVVRDQMEYLLLGKPGFEYLPNQSPAPTNTDIVALLTVLYELEGTFSRDQLRDRLNSALRHVASSYDGLVPAGICILFEAFRRSKSKPCLGLDLEEIADELQANVSRFAVRLAQDRTGAGWQWPNGLLGELEHLSKKSTECGGPAFCGESNGLATR